MPPERLPPTPCSEIVFATVTLPASCNALPTALELGEMFTIPLPSAEEVVARTTPALMLRVPPHVALLAERRRVPLSFLFRALVAAVKPRGEVSVRVLPVVTSRALVAAASKNWRAVVKLSVARNPCVAELALSWTMLLAAPRAESMLAASIPAVMASVPLKVFAELPRTSVPRPAFLSPLTPERTPLSVRPCVISDALAVDTVNVGPPPMESNAMASLSRSP